MSRAPCQGGAVMGDCRAVSVTKPVFADETGRRAIVLLWPGRVVVTVSVISF